jgi:glycine/sarcosine N-methyltransferase
MKNILLFGCLRNKMKLKFDKEPIFAELWDACLYNLLYDSEKYVDEILRLFNDKEITKQSHIIDVSAGTGFPALELIEKGYDVDCMDAMDDEIEVFTEKAKKKGLKTRCKKLTWLEMPKHYKKEDYNLVFCRGNSFIYAAGGWNKSQGVDKKKSLEIYEKTLKVFYNLLEDSGTLYIDKFKDSEKPHKTKVGVVQIKDKKYDLIFYNEVNIKSKERYAAMLLRDENGKEKGLPNMTYLLSGKELEDMLKNVGFKKVEKINLKSEGHFDVWLATK